MPITKQWPGGATNATPTSFSLPLNNELNWLQLTSFLQSLADSAQGTTFQKFKVRVVTASPDTISATADCILAVNVAGAVTINLPAGAEKQIFFIVDSSGAAVTNNITITPNGSETVRGGASLVLNKNYQGVVLAFTGTDWKAFGPFTTPGSITDADFTGQLSTAKGGTGQNSTATFPTSGTVATVPAAGVVKSSGTALTSSNVNLTSEVTGTLPVANGGTGITSFGTGVATFLGTPSSANLASAVTDETGTGALVFANTPTLVTPILGTPQSATLTNATGLPIDAGTTGTLPASRGGTGVTSLGTGVATALGQNVTGSGSIVLSGSPTFTGTPISPSVQISGTAGAGFVELAEQASSPSTPASGFARMFAKSDNKLWWRDDTGLEYEVGSGGTRDIVTQASHGFAEGDVLYINGSTYTKARADSAATAEVVGVVSRIIDINTFEITISGEVAKTAWGLTAGEVYFLDPTTAGAITVTEPSVIGQISAPVGVASSTTTLYVAPKRGVVVGGTNARTQITLSAVTTAQSIYTAPTGVEAGELTGWIYLDATSDLKFYVSAPFAKNGAGTNWNISPSYVGDAIPSGFSMTMTSGGVIQITMSSLPTGYTTGYINYAINAPAVGATFPLAVSGTSVTGGTPTVDTINEYTSTNGVQIKGRTSGNAIAAGYVGETITRYYSQTKTVSTSAYTNLEWSNGVTALNLTAGIWLIKLAALEAAGTANASFRAGISTDSSTTFNDLNQTENSSDVAGAQPGVNSTAVVVTTVNISTATNYYCKAQVATATSRIYQVALKAIRIA